MAPGALPLPVVWGTGKTPEPARGCCRTSPRNPVQGRRRGAGPAHGQAPSAGDICSEDVRRVSEGYEMLHKFRCLEPCKRGAGCALTPSAAQEHLGLTRKSIPPPPTFPRPPNSTWRSGLCFGEAEGRGVAPTDTPGCSDCAPAAWGRCVPLCPPHTQPGCGAARCGQGIPGLWGSDPANRSRRCTGDRVCNQNQRVPRGRGVLRPPHLTAQTRCSAPRAPSQRSAVGIGGGERHKALAHKGKTAYVGPGEGQPREDNAALMLWQ